MKVECAHARMADLVSLVPNPKNANKHSDQQIQLLAKIMKFQGWRHPIVVSKRSGFIVAGHGRLAAAKLNGWTEAPVDEQEFENEAAEVAFLVSDNTIAELAETDRVLVNDLALEMPDDFDLELLGIPDFEIAEIEQIPEGDPDAMPEHVEPRTKLGDIYQLGRHRLMCGDSTSIDDVEKLMAGAKADGVFTDPPYNIGFKPPRGTHDEILNDQMDPAAFGDFLRSVFGCFSAVTKSDSFAFVWSGWSTIDQFAPVLRDFYTIKAMPVWVKNNFGIGYYSRPKYEPFFLCLKGDPPKPDKAPADVWEHAKVHATIHSCEKPVGLIEEILGTYGVKGLVLDLFGGSGSTLIACEKTGRKNYSMELDPKYCDVIISRFEKYSGKKAELLNG